MAYLVDSNVFVRLLHRTDPHHELMRTAVRTLWGQGETLYFTSQNLGEFWSVCTRPATLRGGYGLPVAEVNRRARCIERCYSLLPDTVGVHAEWRRLLVTHAVQGVSVHDARLVAAMKVHDITHILTLDDKDFARYTEIAAVHPQNV